MITGFEEITEELTAVEREILPHLADRLNRRIGVKNALTAKQITAGYYLKLGVKFDGPRVRKMITVARLEGLVPRLVATSKGYYIAETKEDLMRYDESLMGREDAIKALRSNIQNDIRNFNI